MSAEKGSTTYSKSGQKISFDDIVHLTAGFMDSTISGDLGERFEYQERVMPSALDRRTRVPIYKLDKAALEYIRDKLKVEPNIVAARSPSVFYPEAAQKKSAIFMNPLKMNFSGRPLDAKEVEKVLTHEMAHEWQVKHPDVVEKVDAFLDNLKNSFSTEQTDANRQYAQVKKELSRIYPESDLKHEAQAFLSSGTLPMFYGKKTAPKAYGGLGMIFSRPEVPLSHPSVAAGFQKYAFPLMPKQMQERMKGTAEEQPAPEPGVLDRFLSIIGLGTK